MMEKKWSLLGDINASTPDWFPPHLLFHPVSSHHSHKPWACNFRYIITKSEQYFHKDMISSVVCMTSMNPFFLSLFIFLKKKIVDGNIQPLLPKAFIYMQFLFVFKRYFVLHHIPRLLYFRIWPDPAPF